MVEGQENIVFYAWKENNLSRRMAIAKVIGWNKINENVKSQMPSISTSGYKGVVRKDINRSEAWLK